MTHRAVTRSGVRRDVPGRPRWWVTWTVDCLTCRAAGVPQSVTPILESKCEEMKLIDCAERKVLERAAASILDEIIELTKRQRKALHEQQGVELMRLDK